MNQNLVPLITYMVSQIRELDGRPVKTQLVKLLYLLDLDFYKRHHRIFTELNWFYYHYGPYAIELEDVLKNIPDIDESSFISSKGRKGFSYTPEGDFEQSEQRMLDLFGSQVKILTDRIIKDWALEDLWVLLDYVYFDTEPMQNAQRGEPLDFSTVKTTVERMPDIQKAVIPKERILELRNQFEDFKKQRQIEIKTSLILAPYDDVYYEALYMMNEDEKIAILTPRGQSVKGP